MQKSKIVNGVQIFYFEEEYIAIKEWPTVGDIVKSDWMCQFERFRDGNFFYRVHIPKHIYEFFIPVEDVGTATLDKSGKAITFMRWIRKCIEDKTLRELPVLYA